MKTKRKKKHRGGMDPGRSLSRSRSSRRSRSRRGRPRLQTPRRPINKEDFQHVDEVAMNVFRNTRDIKKIMADLVRIKMFLNIPPSHSVPNINIQEVDG